MCLWVYASIQWQTPLFANKRKNTCIKLQSFCSVPISRFSTSTSATDLQCTCAACKKYEVASDREIRSIASVFLDTWTKKKAQVELTKFEIYLLSSVLLVLGEHVLHHVERPALIDAILAVQQRSIHELRRSMHLRKRQIVRRNVQMVRRRRQIRIDIAFSQRHKHRCFIRTIIVIHIHVSVLLLHYKRIDQFVLILMFTFTCHEI